MQVNIKAKNASADYLQKTTAVDSSLTPSFFIIINLCTEVNLINSYITIFGGGLSET
jgi:hypothetical protein